MLSFSQTLKAQGYTVTTKVLMKEVLPAPFDVATRLQINSNAPMIVIRRLRGAHVAVSIGGLLLLPTLVAVGLAARREVPVNDSTWWPHSAPAADLDAAGPLRWHVALAEGGTSVDVQPSRDLQEPDLLVYWVPQAGSLTELPEEALLVGTLLGGAPRRFVLPPAAPQTEP